VRVSTGKGADEVSQISELLGIFRSSEGASNFCRVKGYISTVGKNGGAVLMAIRGAIGGEPFMPSAA
jgi:hypothetical protein